MRLFKGHTAAAIATAAILGFGSGAAEAAPILVSDTFDWAGLNAGTTFTEPNLPTWTHDLTFDPQAASFNYVQLDLRHAGNVGNVNELWILTSQGSVFIDNLSDSSNSETLSGNAVTDTFNIPISLFPVFPAGSWTLALRLAESTSGNDKITLDYATLRVSYEPVTTGGGTTIPEPASLLLFGMAGLAARRVVRRKN